MIKRFKTSLLLGAFAATTFSFSSCSELKSILGDGDIAGGLKEALISGVMKANGNAQNGSLFNGTNILASVLPENVTKIISTLQSLGLGGEVTRFTTTLTNAATKSAEKSVPIFVSGIRNMTIVDAVGILGGGYNAATNYLRGKIGDSIQNAIKPEIAGVLTEYKMPQTAGDLAGKNIPVIGNQKLNIDFTTLLSKLVANQMFKEVEAQELKIRTDVSARTTPLLQQVFGSSKAYKQ